jgi:light-regulated signal transduction histidine kinase (bacteriophytochrome)
MTIDLKTFSREEAERMIKMLQRELEATNHEVLLLNLELEKRVDERTAELKAANQELEAFSYSVSHDLRAPLRTIGAFSEILLKDFGGQLSPEGQRLLNIVITSSGQMRQMIEDLLNFSRLGRQSLSIQVVDFSALVNEVLRDLRNGPSRAAVEVKVDDLPPCKGDPSLLKQVFVNLLSNAFKFSRHKEKPVVEVGCTQQNGERTYFVRDNGAGFDMRHSEKLFGVFQRLHSGDRFEGTGVGLSIVQRIVHRHGGRIWAEAEVDKGATFYFTLPC